MGSLLYLLPLGLALIFLRNIWYADFPHVVAVYIAPNKLVGEHCATVTYKGVVPFLPLTSKFTSVDGNSWIDSKGLEPPRGIRSAIWYAFKHYEATQRMGGE